MPAGGEIDYLAHLASESARFAEVLAGAAPAAPVPSCPDWTADDLLWHLAKVQWFWGTVVTRGVRIGAEASQIDAEQLSAGRPAGHGALAEFFAEVSAALSAALAAASPETPMWTWAEDKTVGFIRRRQAHEALIHRVDAELTVGQRTRMDPRLSADGVDEALRVMFGGDVPAWGRFEPDDGRTVLILAGDTGDSWLVELGRFTGTDPANGTGYDEAGIRVAEAGLAARAASSVQAAAADLDCWLWGRPTAAAPLLSGDPGVLARFGELVAAGIS